MHLEKLAMVNFRNYEKAEVHFKSKINLIFGLNAQGKTNFLEAIYLLCLGRSFRQAKNQDLLRIGSSYFTIEGRLNYDNALVKVAALHYQRDGKKEISIDRKRMRGYSDIFGAFPVVIISPEDYKITTGGPAERRRFIDILLSQISLSYLTHLQEYQRILKQRNRILQDMKAGKLVADSTIAPWNEKMISVGSKIVGARYDFVEEFVRWLRPIYREYSGAHEEIGLRLETLVSRENSEQSFAVELNRLSQRERALGVSLVGPHRDDLIITINGRELRTFGSRGEHKALMIALKLAELQFLKNKKDETPIFLLDDCFSELDEVREKNVFFSFQGLGQMVITSPRQKDFFGEADAGEVSRFVVENGVIQAL